MITLVLFSCMCLCRLSEGQDYDFILYQGDAVITAELSNSVCTEQCQSNYFTSRLAVKTTAIHDKIGKVCKCVHIDKHINERGCISRCAGDDRLEGSGYDKCNFIDGVCYMYNYIQAQQT